MDYSPLNFWKKSWTIVHEFFEKIMDYSPLFSLNFMKKSWTIAHGKFLKKINPGVYLFSPSRPTTIVHNSSQYLVLMQLISK